MSLFLQCGISMYLQ